MTRSTAWMLALALACLIPARGARGDFVSFGASDPGLPPPSSESALDASNSAIEAGFFREAASSIGTAHQANLASVPIGSVNGPESIGPGITLTLSGVDRSPPAGYSFGIADDHPNVLTGYSTDADGRFIRVVPETYAPPGVAAVSTTATFTFTTPVDAFGLYATGLGSVHGRLTMEATVAGANGPVTSPIVGSSEGGLLFFGFTDAGASITSISLVLSGETAGDRDVYGLSGISFYTPVPVPEPSALSLSAVAALALLARRLARRRA